MEYPKTMGSALDALQGSWEMKGGKMSFTISGMKIINPIGVESQFGEITNDMDFTLTDSLLKGKWRINCGSVFGTADIISWEDSSFTTSQPITVKSTTNYPKSVVTEFVRIP